MNKRFALSHITTPLIVLIVLVCVVTLLANNMLCSIYAVKDGIEIISVDMAVADKAALSKSIKNFTKERYAEFSDVDLSSTKEYVSSIKNYTLHDYFDYLAQSRDAELMIVSESLLDEVFLMKTVVKLDIEVSDEKCIFNGQTYAVPLDGSFFSAGDDMFSKQKAYAVLLNGDKCEKVKQFLKEFNYV